MLSKNIGSVTLPFSDAHHDDVRQIHHHDGDDGDARQIRHRGGDDDGGVRDDGGDAQKTLRGAQTVWGQTEKA